MLTTAAVHQPVDHGQWSIDSNAECVRGCVFCSRFKGSGSQAPRRRRVFCICCRHLCGLESVSAERVCLSMSARAARTRDELQPAISLRHLRSNNVLTIPTSGASSRESLSLQLLQLPVGLWSVSGCRHAQLTPIRPSWSFENSSSLNKHQVPQQAETTKHVSPRGGSGGRGGGGGGRG